MRSNNVLHRTAPVSAGVRRHQRMDTEISTLARFGLWLRSKRNFYLFFVLAVGGTNAIVLSFMFGGLMPSSTWIAFIVGCCLIGGLLTGIAMWHFFRWRFPSMRDGRGNDAV